MLWICFDSELQACRVGGEIVFDGEHEAAVGGGRVFAEDPGGAGGGGACADGGGEVVFGREEEDGARGSTECGRGKVGGRVRMHLGSFRLPPSPFRLRVVWP